VEASGAQDLVNDRAAGLSDNLRLTLESVAPGQTTERTPFRVSR